MQDVVIDLNREPEIKELIADRSVGDSFTLYATIKSKDEQTLVITTKEADAEARDEDEEVGEEDEEGMDEDDKTSSPTVKY